MLCNIDFKKSLSEVIELLKYNLSIFCPLVFSMAFVTARKDSIEVIA